jgi:hypothetical protein
MADLTFDCPLCHQPIAFDEQWCGHEIQCPTCHGALVMPPAAAPSIATARERGNPLVPKPPAASKLSLGGASQQPASSGNRNIPIRNLAPPPPKKKSPLVKIAVTLGVLIALGFGGYFGYFWVRDMQEKASAKSREAAKNADGGQVGHISELYNVLDATDPNRGGVPRGGRPTGPRQRPSGVGEQIPVPGAGGTSAGSVDTNAPIVPAIWSLDVDTAKIPDSRVNGTISGTNFVAETVRVDPVGTAQVLRFIQGVPTAPDREILVYLHLKPGEALGGQTLTINKDMRGFGVPQVAKRWKVNPKYAPSLKSFNFGYALKLELGQATNGLVSGKIFVALPDPEQSVAGGSFEATINAAAAPQQAAQAPTAVPVADPAARAAFENRYGKKR